MKSKSVILKKSFGLYMATVILVMYSLAPALMPSLLDGSLAYAANNGGVTIETIGSPGGTQGDSNVSVGFQIENNRNEAVTVQSMKLTIAGGGVTIGDNTGSMVIPSGGKQTVSFSVEIAKHATTGERSCQFNANLKGEDGGALSNQKTLEESTFFTVYERMSTDGTDSKTVAAVDISHTIQPVGGFVQGNDNKLKIEFYNYGNTTIKNARVSLTLPEGLSIYNGSNQADLGYVSVGTRKTVEFPITVKKGIESKNYAVEVDILGLNFMNGDVVAKKTFYIPVEGEDQMSTDNINIIGINIPEEMLAGQPFDMSFSVKNTGTSDMKNVKVTVEPAEGIINKSKNIFIDNIPKGGSVPYSIKLYSFEGTEEKSYPIKITASPGSSTSEKDTVAAVTQYATVSIKSDGTVAKKPQLLVDNYTYGGSTVQAGSDFYLNLGIFNTSGKTLTNIKVALSTEDGTFVPTGSSNSFFVDSIPAKGHYTKSVRLSVKPQAEQKTTAVTVAMTYEDSSGNPFEASDIVSVPVTQQTKLVIDDLVPPMEVYVGMQGTCELQFYNMGKTTLNNLRVNCEGNFDVMESNSYYAGNMDTGKSDSYRFNYVPREVGPMEGTITFTFEDGMGKPQFLEVPFTFEVMDMPVMEEDPNMEMPEDKKVPWSLIIAGAVVAVAVIGGVLFKKHRKKKLHAALEIEDDYDIDLDENGAEDKTETIKSKIEDK